MFDRGTSTLASQVRLWRGTAAFRPAGRQPEIPLELYEFEGSPFCRLVREALTQLDLDVQVFPCPMGGTRFVPDLVALGGKPQRPFLVDPNTGRSLYESADIVAYLATTYEGAPRATTRARGLARYAAVGTSYVATAVRALRGSRARPSRAPAQPLELYSFESSPYARLVREVLSELEIPYLLRQFGKRRWVDMGPPWVRTRLFPGAAVTGRNRRLMFDTTGRLQVPYLVDPNTAVSMFESTAIVAYLERTYAR